MAKSVNDKIYSAILYDHINVLRLSEIERIKAEKLLLDVRKKIIDQLIRKDPLGTPRTPFQRKRLKSLYEKVDEILKANFDKLSKETQASLVGMSKYAFKSTAGIINKAIGVDVVSGEISMNRVKAIVNGSMIDGKFIGTWWKKQAKDFQSKFKDSIEEIANEFRISAIQGESLGAMVGVVASGSSLMNYTANQARALIQTSYMQVLADTRSELYKENRDVIHATRWVSTLDKRTCLTADSEILTPDGYKNILKIGVGDLVIGGISKQPQRIIGTSKTKAKQIVTVTLEDDKTIRCTPEHQFLLKDGRWIEAQYLTPEMDSAGRWHEKKTKSVKIENSNEEVYDVEVENDACFFVHDIVLHNSPFCQMMDGATWDMDGNPILGTAVPFQEPPAHFRCRSILVAIVDKYKNVAREKPQLKSLDEMQRSSMDGLVPASTTYKEWFETLPELTRKEILGPKRFELYTRGKLSASDMLKVDGTPLTIKELTNKVDKLGF